MEIWRNLASIWHCHSFVTKLTEVAAKRSSTSRTTGVPTSRPNWPPIGGQSQQFPFPQRQGGRAKPWPGRCNCRWQHPIATAAGRGASLRSVQQRGRWIPLRCTQVANMMFIPPHNTESLLHFAVVQLVPPSFDAQSRKYVVPFTIPI